MMRTGITGLMLLAVALVATPTFGADSPSGVQQASLVEKLASLRSGWGESSDADDEPLPPAPVARAEGSPPLTLSAPSQEPAAIRPAPTAKPATSRLPRINPRSLMPRDFFSPKAPTAPQATSRPSARAGSTLSAENQPVDAQMTSGGQAPAAPTASRRSASLHDELLGLSGSGKNRVSKSDPALARKIAADVAASLSAESESIANQADESTGTSSRIDPESAADEALEIIAQATRAVVGPTSSKKPTPKLAANTADRYAADKNQGPFGSDTGNETTPASATGGAKAIGPTGARLKVSQDQATKTLPLVIGQQAPAIPVAAQPAKQAWEASKSAAPAQSEPSLSASPAGELSADETDLLFTQKTPLIVSRVSGPRSIVIGREANYRVTLANRGEVAANKLVTRVSLPEGVEVASTKSSLGAVRRDATGSDTNGSLEWEMSEFSARGAATLDLVLVARTGRPIELGVSWSHDPVDSHTLVEVQEPKLEMNISGPDDVLFSRSQLYRLTLSNPGTGTAENVVLNLLPPGTGEQAVSSHPFGSLAPGESRSVEIELTAREAGKLAVKASALADGGVKAEAVKELFCRKPDLVVDWRGPEKKYSGVEATYYFRVRNQGTAIANDVTFDVDVPEGFEFLAASNDSVSNPDEGKVTFHVGSLRPGDDHYMELRGVVYAAGENRFGLKAASADQVATALDTATTMVTALADLKLSVQDPKGPVPTGSEAVYEIRVRNRGASAAEEVKVVGLFSAGIEPLSASGASTRVEINDGVVSFNEIGSLPVGEEVVFTIRAKANEPGTHLFRAEVLCKDLEIKLAAEETTRFFREEGINLDGAPRSAGISDRFATPR
ncbi:Large cysteine-rich periplasmic protein OmcB precursor [Pseudobythopirellula maris]|uniref:Large cysteine-rich periplasmic protein OmcB n=1 Tax=Pseudobythopirellula maris TaxID=2527991 RepID=A0A5C5ZI34_9BACT|nr:DUF11 domain-containing protein [Pseudobythopirellula maris]TWT86896.1 Large cysteine-rich periplasmic protein OmcB precursor [Pseudobythopirellula maris]